MRTATITAKTHSGAWKLLANRDVAVEEQRKAFKELAGSRTHAEFSLVIFQGSDEVARQARFRTPEAQATLEEKQARERRQYEVTHGLESAAPAPAAVQKPAHKAKAGKKA